MALRQAEQGTVMKNADDTAVYSFAEPGAMWVPKRAVFSRYSFSMPLKLTVRYTCRHLYVEKLRCFYCTIQITNSK
jgi:hypothetical protein